MKTHKYEPGEIVIHAQYNTYLLLLKLKTRVGTVDINTYLARKLFDENDTYAAVPEEWIFDDRRTGRYHAGG